MFTERIYLRSVCCRMMISIDLCSPESTHFSIRMDVCANSLFCWCCHFTSHSHTHFSYRSQTLISAACSCICNHRTTSMQLFSLPWLSPRFPLSFSHHVPALHLMSWPMVRLHLSCSRNWFLSAQSTRKW